MMFGNELLSLQSEIPFWKTFTISSVRTQLVVKKSQGGLNVTPLEKL